jgi:hypothetical protein
LLVKCGAYEREHGEEGGMTGSVMKVMGSVKESGDVSSSQLHAAIVAPPHPPLITKLVEKLVVAVLKCTGWKG